MAVALTENAAKRVRSLMDDQGNPDMNLRAFVTGGGCSGYQYGFSFDDQVKEDDTVVECFGVRLVVDQSSLGMLDGSEIDFESTVQGETFVIRNPNAESNCGCGNSFTPAESGNGCAHSSGY